MASPLGTLSNISPPTCSTPATLLNSSFSLQILSNKSQSNFNLLIFINWNNTWKRGGMFYDMRQVKINTLNMWICGGDEANGLSQTTPNIHQLPKLLKTFVNLKDLLENQSSLVVHCFVENLIKSWVHAWILESMHFMDPVKGNSSFKNCTFQLRPAIQCSSGVKLSRV